ncbi:MAG: hypothetical protein HYU66_11870, partial [Armatimonadetes bacterium]|nr:hypothetical protein [Armatimonadota bacterium]
TFGVFWLSLPATMVTRGKPAELAITATTQGSRRWLAIAPYTDAAAMERVELSAE